MAELQMRSHLVRPALALVRRAGGDVEALCARHGLSAAAALDGEAVLSLERLDLVLEDAARAAREPSIGLQLAESLETGTFGVAEYACRTAPTVGEGLRRLVRYIALLNELVEIGLEERDGEARIEQRVSGRALCVGRHANEFFVAFALRSVRMLSSEPCRARRVWLAHPDLTDRAAIERLSGTAEVHVGAESNGVALERAVLDRVLTSADPNLHRILAAQAEHALAGRANAGRFLGRFRQLLREALDGGTPSIEPIAQRMAMSARTLQRRLGEEGTSFQPELDAVRAQLARIYIADPALSFAEVAFLLGYSDLTAFVRAFRRWTGLTPSQARAARG